MYIYLYILIIYTYIYIYIYSDYNKKLVRDTQSAQHAQSKEYNTYIVT